MAEIFVYSGSKCTVSFCHDVNMKPQQLEIGLPIT